MHQAYLKINLCYNYTTNCINLLEIISFPVSNLTLGYVNL